MVCTVSCPFINNCAALFDLKNSTRYILCRNAVVGFLYSYINLENLIDHFNFIDRSTVYKHLSCACYCKCNVVCLYVSFGSFSFNKLIAALRKLDNLFGAVGSPCCNNIIVVIYIYHLKLCTNYIFSRSAVVNLNNGYIILCNRCYCCILHFNGGLLNAINCYLSVCGYCKYYIVCHFVA